MHINDNYLTVKKNPDMITVTVSAIRTPVLFALKVKEHMASGMTQKEAEETAEGSEYILNLYYEQECGLFAVEQEVLDCSRCWSPYTQKELTVENDKKKLKDAENMNIFRIFRNHHGQQTIKILGYFYEGDECWKHLEFGGLEMPLTEWMEASEETRELWESEAKQYINDMTEHEAAEALLSYEAKPIANEDINENTPEGNYI